VILKRDPELMACDERGRRSARDAHASGARCHEPRDRAQERRFPATRRPDDRDETAGDDVEIDRSEGRDGATALEREVDAQIRYGDGRRVVVSAYGVTA
jgi:hypothetical protein